MRDPEREAEAYARFRAEGLDLDKDFDGRPMYFDKAGEPVTFFEWAELREEPGYRRIGFTEVCEGVEVSTVWLGMNHNWYDGPPIIFETLVFSDDTGTECYRYSTEAQAVAGHDRVVAELRAQVPR